MQSTIIKRSLSLASYPYPLFRKQILTQTQLSFFSPVKDSNSIGIVLSPIIEETESDTPVSSFHQAPLFESSSSIEQTIHQVIKTNYLKSPTLIAQAEHLKNGWLHIPDERVFSPYGRVPDPEDIFGSVLVEDSKLVPDSYQRFVLYFHYF